MELESYQDHFERLINLEKEEEMRRHEQEMIQLSAREREDKGRCLTNMTSVSSSQGMGGERHVKFTKASKDPLPDHELTIGDLVQISHNEPLSEDNPTATVWKKTGRSITLSLSQDLPGWARGDDLRIDLYVDNVTYNRMLDSLFVLRGLPRERERLRDVLLENESPRIGEVPSDVSFINERLNYSQREAVGGSLAAEDVFLVHGPPGTGKTVTLTEVIGQAVRRDQSVLATAASNTAVDNLLSILIDQDVDAVRVGHPARTIPGLREHTLDYRLEDEPAYQKSVEKRQQAMELVERRRDKTAPSGRWRRGMSNDWIRELAEEGRGNRGVSPEKIQEMAEYLEMSDRIDELFEACDRLEEKAIDRVLEEADVVCTTNSTAGSDVLSGAEFDLLCLDEATQATEPSCLIPITKAEKLVMAGDHRQLPPTILNEEARQSGLDETLFERLVEAWGDAIKEQLTVQYRMHEDIMDFSNDYFYSGTLSADESVRTHTLEGLPRYHPEGLDSPFRDSLRPRPPVVWLDTTALEAPERQRSGSTSVHNPTEARICTALTRSLLDAGLEPTQLAVIAPYADQVEAIRDRLDTDGLEIDTVDGFQGREKEVVLMDLVRSNDEGEVGFLYDQRRLNVSLTRARRKLIIVGDGDTLSRHRLYRDLSEYVDDRGRLVKLTEESLSALEV
jgi:predicted DNA helicase